MISRKEYLLTRPWQQRKYDHHRRKVQSALPAIDTNPPVNRGHVTVKLKKQQKEYERCKKIERDNFLLLQKMNYITRTSRVDNIWRKPPPNFLNKIGIYNTVVHKMEDVVDCDFEITENTPEQRNRKSRCYACGSKTHEEPKETEETPPTRKLVTRNRSKSVPVRKTEPLPQIKEHENVYKKNSASNKVSADGKRTVSDFPTSRQKYKNEVLTKEPHSILITRGCLKLSVNFPSDTVVKFEKGNVKKLLMDELCHCKSSRKVVC